MPKDIKRVVRKDMVKVLKRAQRYINNGNSKRLKHLSDYTIHNASVYQDSDSLSVAVIVYALSKLLERFGFDSEHAEQARNLLGSAQFSLEQNNIEEYRDNAKKLFEFISSIEKQFKIYVDKVLEKAKIKKGGSLYEQGLSAATSADFMGISQWELVSYIGKTRIHDRPEHMHFSVSDAEKRVEYARSLFK